MVPCGMVQVQGMYDGNRCIIHPDDRRFASEAKDEAKRESLVGEPTTLASGPSNEGILEVSGAEIPTNTPAEAFTGSRTRLAQSPWTYMIIM